MLAEMIGPAPSAEEVAHKNLNPPRYALCKRCGNIVIEEAWYKDNGSVDRYVAAHVHQNYRTGEKCEG